MKIILMGKYNQSEILTGPEKVAKRIYQGIQNSQKINAIFIEYFFEGNKYSLLIKLFGFEVIDPVAQIFKVGLIRLPYVILKFHPDIIHFITYERFAVIALLFGFTRKIIYCFNIHGIINYENSVLKPDISLLLKIKDYICERLYIYTSDLLLFPSVDSVKIAQMYFTINITKIKIITHGIDKVFIGISKEINEIEKLKIIAVGEEKRKEKGIEFLINALGKLKFKIDLFLIGCFDQVQLKSNDSINISLVKKMDTVRFAEFLKDKDVFISSSFYETFSISALEAMAAGLVLVVTANTGISSILTDFGIGFVYEYGDSDTLCTILSNLNYTRKKVNKNSDKLKCRYEKMMWGNIVAKYIELYNELIKTNHENSNYTQ